MKSDITKQTIAGGIVGAVILCLYSLLIMRLAGIVLNPGTSWINIALSTVFSTTSLVGGALGAATGYALTTAKDKKYSEAAKICTIAGVLALIYALITPLQSLLTGIAFANQSGASIASFIAMSFFPLILTLFTNIVLLWSVLLLFGSAALRRKKSGAT
jgi:hypothetical protein